MSRLLISTVLTMLAFWPQVCHSQVPVSAAAAEIQKQSAAFSDVIAQHAYVVTSASVRPAHPVPSTVKIDNVVASSSGIHCTLRLSMTKLLAATIAGPDPGNGDFTIPVVGWITIPFDTSFGGGEKEQTVSVNIPVILEANPAKQYLVTFSAGSDVLPNGASSGYNHDRKVVNGYSPQIAPFTLEFNKDTLKISARTSSANTTLTAAWVASDGTHKGQFQDKKQDPNVELKYMDIGSPAMLPSINIKLENPDTKQVQETDLKISVNTTDPVAKQAKQSVTSTSNQSSSDASKQKITFQGFTQSVLGALVKYFAF